MYDTMFAYYYSGIDYHGMKVVDVSENVIK